MGSDSGKITEGSQLTINLTHGKIKQHLQTKILGYTNSRKISRLQNQILCSVQQTLTPPAHTNQRSYFSTGGTNHKEVTGNLAVTQDNKQSNVMSRKAE